jgi:hypothetical protein
MRPIILAGQPMWLSTSAVGRAVGDGRARIGFPAPVIAGLAVYAAVVSLLDRRFLPGARSQVLRMLGSAGSAAYRAAAPYQR